MDVLQIELINRCNAKCVFCPYPRKTTPNRPDMSMELFEKILTDAQEIQPKEVYPFLNGEPFLDDHLADKLEMINKILPETYIQIFTNGHLMTPQRIRGLRHITKIKSINVSVNSVEDAKRRVLMGLPYQQTRSNIEFAKNFLSIPICTSMVYDVCYVNSNDIRNYQNEMCLLEVNHGLFPSGNWAGKVRKCYANYDRCVRPFLGMTILADGRSVLCCFDSEGEVELGDLKIQSMNEIWESEEYHRIRELHNQGRRNELKLCDNCTTI